MKNTSAWNPTVLKLVIDAKKYVNCLLLLFPIQNWKAAMRFKWNYLRALFQNCVTHVYKFDISTCLNLNSCFMQCFNVNYAVCGTKNIRPIMASNISVLTFDDTRHRSGDLNSCKNKHLCNSSVKSTFFLQLRELLYKTG